MTLQVTCIKHIWQESGFLDVKGKHPLADPPLTMMLYRLLISQCVVIINIRRILFINMTSMVLMVEVAVSFFCYPSASFDHCEEEMAVITATQLVAEEKDCLEGEVVV